MSAERLTCYLGSKLKFIWVYGAGWSLGLTLLGESCLNIYNAPSQIWSRIFWSGYLVTKIRCCAVFSILVQATRKTTDVFQHGERKVIYWQIVWQFHEHYLPSLLACTVCRVQSRICVIYANFSTHRQDVRAETRICQSVGTFNHITVVITFVAVTLFLAVRCWARLGRALPSICFNMCRLICSEIFHVSVSSNMLFADLCPTCWAD